MKNLLTFTNGLAAIAAVGLMAGCQTAGTTNGGTAASQKEMLLTQAGFRAKTVTTTRQQQHLAALPEAKVSAVTHKGKLYYVYPTATKNQVLVGNQTQYNAYKKALQAQRASQAQMTAPDFAEETAGPHHVLIEEFDGFGPLGD